MCARIRASILLAAPLLARCGRAELSPPGGDVIGRRRLDTHFLALERLGATHEFDDRIAFTTKRLARRGCIPRRAERHRHRERRDGRRRRRRGRPSSAMPRASRTCRTCAISSLRLARRSTESARTFIRIQGGKPLHGATHAIGPDHIEVGSFIGLAAVTRSDARVSSAPASNTCARSASASSALASPRTIEGDDLIVPATQSMEIQSDLGGHVPKLEDQPWPAFPADVMSIAIVTATQCAGLVLMHEKMFESRLFFVDKLVGMGARIVLCDPHRALVGRPERAARRDGRIARHPRRDGDAYRRALRKRDEHDQQRRPDRARLRTDRRASRRARCENQTSGDRTRVTAASSRDPIPLREKVAQFASIGVEAFTTTRAAGDYGLGEGEPPVDALARWHALQREFAEIAPRLASARQVHGTKLLEHSAGAEGWTVMRARTVTSPSRPASRAS